MKQTGKTSISIALGALVAFALWTIAITRIDVQPIGPNGTAVGFATLNGAFHDLTGVHWLIYDITDWMGLVALFTAFGFTVLGFCQMVHRRSILKVDADILILGVFYALVIAGYLFFEVVAINYRPVLVNGCLEASYPSSTTLLVLSVMPTAIMQLKSRIHNRKVRNTAVLLMAAFAVLMVVGRTVSGVHWLTDIAGGVLLSLALVMFYRAATNGCAKFKPEAVARYHPQPHTREHVTMQWIEKGSMK